MKLYGGTKIITNDSFAFYLDDLKFAIRKLSLKFTPSHLSAPSPLLKEKLNEILKELKKGGDKK